jgi:hypothetical protein
LGIGQDRLHSSPLLLPLGELKIFLNSVAITVLVVQVRVSLLLLVVITFSISTGSLSKESRYHSLVSLLDRFA